MPALAPRPPALAPKPAALAPSAPAAPAMPAPPEGFKLRPKAPSTPIIAPLPPLAAPPAAAPPPPAVIGAPLVRPGMPPGVILPPAGAPVPLAPPPAPGSAPEAPAAPGNAPKLTMAPPGAPPAAPGPPGATRPPGLGMKVAADGKKPAVKPPVKGPVGKSSSAPGPLKKKAKLGLMPKIGIGVLVVAFAVGIAYTYRIFFPPPLPQVTIAPPPALIKGPSAADVARAQAAAAKAAADATALALKLAQERAAKANAEQPTPTPTPEQSESVMVATDLGADVKVNSTRVDANIAAGPAFRAFVASATIGGVFQGHPSRALINGVIAREGQVIDEVQGITFERIDAERKTIYFRDSTGAEVSKNY